MIRNKLKSWRHKYEMNQKEFAEFLGVPAAQVSRWESQKQQPTIESAILICKKLKITNLEELFEITDPE